MARLERMNITNPISDYSKCIEAGITLRIKPGSDEESKYLIDKLSEIWAHSQGQIQMVLLTPMPNSSKADPVKIDLERNEN